MLTEPGQAHKPLERRLPHLMNVLNADMIRNQRFNLLSVVVREPQLQANSFGHPCSDLDVPVEPDACTRPSGWSEGWRLAHVVQQHAPSQRWGAIWRMPFQHHQSVNPHVSFRMKLRWLLHALHARYVREHDCKQSRFIEQFEPPPRGTLGQQFCQFLTYPLGRNLRDMRRQRLGCRQSLRLDLEAETRSKPDGAHHA